MELHLRTSERTNGGISDASWNLKRKLEGNFMCLKQLGFFYTRYPVQTHSFVFHENGSTATTFTASVPAGVYTTTTYAAALQVAMNAVGGIANSYAVTGSADTGRLTIVPSTVTLGIKISDMTTAGKRYSGFNSATAFSMSRTGDTFVNLAGPLFIDLFLNNSAGPCINSNGITFLARVPLTEPFGDQIIFDNSTYPTDVPLASQGNTFQITIVDEFGEAFTNATDFYYIFKLKV